MSTELADALDEAVGALKTIVAQYSGNPLSTSLADCMAVIARATLSNIEKKIPHAIEAMGDKARNHPMTETQKDAR
jgi:hypothetical protein